MPLWKTLMKLLIALHHRNPAWIAPPWFTERLMRDFPQLEVVQLPNYDRVIAEIADAELAITWSLRPDQIAAAKKLRWIHSTAAAVHALMTPDLVAGDVVVTSARAVHGPVVAEHALALAFALAKRIPQAARAQQRKHWAQLEIANGEIRPRELRESTLAIIGIGSIGSALARLAKSIGMRVLGVREHPEHGDPSVEQMFGFDQLGEAVHQADFTVLAVPVTPKTHHLMNAERLALMRRDGYLINVGRGVLIDEEALIAALRRDQFAGAGLDVTAEEPLAQDSPLWSMENVLITPHIGGYADKMWERHYELFSENLRRHLAGEPLLWIVDKQRGY